MEPGVIRMFSSSPPPMDDALDEEDDEFGDFGTFSGVSAVPTSISFSELDTPTTFNQTRALNATSPPDLSLSSNGHLTRPERSLKDGQSAGSNAGSKGLQMETITNGFQGSPTSQKSGPFSHDEDDDFADFSTFSDHANTETLDEEQFPEFMEHDAVKRMSNPHRTETQFANFAAFPEVSEVTLDDGQSTRVYCQKDLALSEELTDRTDPRLSHCGAFPDDCTLENHFTGSETASRDGDAAFHLRKEETQTLEDCSSLNGSALDATGSVCSSDLASESDGGGENAEGSGAAVNGAAEKDKDGGSETETETSLGRPLSTEALEEFGDMSTTGSVPSPPLQEETATPTGDDEEFGEFGLGVHECGDGEQRPKAQNHDDDDEDDFGDFNSPEFKTEEKTEFPTSESFGNFNSCVTAEREEPSPPPHRAHAHRRRPDETRERRGDSAQQETNGKSKGEIPESESFGNFSSAAEAGHETALQREEDEDEEEDGFGEFGDFTAPDFTSEARLRGGASEEGVPRADSFGGFGSAAEEEETAWSAFGNEDAKDDSGGGETWAAFSTEVTGVTGVTEVTEVTEVTGVTGETRGAVTGVSSAGTSAHVVGLWERLQLLFGSSFPQIEASSVDEATPTLRLLLEPGTHTQTDSPPCVEVWSQLEDVHEAVGLRFQWGGSSCNKALLCSLGIDTRNILFTGQKKQPVIVPMYAAGLGMLEPVKPVSAAEMIASIAHNSPCSPESVQEALPPVQFDWSSSGLTNPLDGVDPELFELTTVRLDSHKTSDAFARLMSTVQSTSTTRKPRRQENLSEEALKVISRFPDLSFMTAKVLMFPTTLTPHRPQTGTETGTGTETETGSGPGLDQGSD